MNKIKQDLEKRKYKQTEKHRDNLSESHKGMHNSPKTEFKKGRVPWNKGIKRKDMTGKNHPSWKGGRYIDKIGYILIYSPNHKFKTKKGYVLEHRLVVEKFIGRLLNPKEAVHHIDENKQNNKIENLMLFENNGKHIKFHLKIKQFGVTNPIKRQIKNRWKNIIKLKTGRILII